MRRSGAILSERPCWVFIAQTPSQTIIFLLGIHCNGRVYLTPARIGCCSLSQSLLLASPYPCCWNKHHVRCVASSMPMWIRADDMTGVAPQDTDGSPMDAIRPKYLVGSATDLVMGSDPTMPPNHTVLSLLVG